jgi:hypothetical protein
LPHTTLFFVLQSALCNLNVLVLVFAIFFDGAASEAVTNVSFSDHGMGKWVNGIIFVFFSDFVDRAIVIHRWFLIGIAVPITPNACQDLSWWIFSTWSCTNNQGSWSVVIFPCQHNVPWLLKLCNWFKFWCNYAWKKSWEAYIDSPCCWERASLLPCPTLLLTEIESWFFFHNICWPTLRP